MEHGFFLDDLFQSPDQPPMVAPRRNIGGHDVANRMSHASSVFTTSDDLEQHELDYSSRFCFSINNNTTPYLPCLFPLYIFVFIAL